MSSSVKISEDVCRQVAERLADSKLRPDFYTRPFLSIKAPAETLFRGYFYAVAICHQTYHLRHADLNLYGWDYLEYVFTLLMASGDPFLLPGNVSADTPEQVEEKLASMFPKGFEDKATSLDKLRERVLLLMDLDEFIGRKFNDSLEQMVLDCRNRLLDEGAGLYEILGQTEAFRDPYRKKSTFLVKLLEEAGLLKILDTANFIPIMDYHMQRVLMRLGCVEIMDMNLKNKLINHEPLQSDEVVRSACINAFHFIADASGTSVTKLNDYFWSLGRSCCNEKPLCEFHSCEKAPCTFTQIIKLEEHSDCYFRKECKGYRDAEYRKLWQPVVETHYY